MKENRQKREKGFLGMALENATELSKKGLNKGVVERRIS